MGYVFPLSSKIIVTIGLPGSRKIHILRSQSGRKCLISSDAIRLQLADDPTNQTIHGKVFATMRYLLRQRLDLERPVTYIDATNLTAKRPPPRGSKSPATEGAKSKLCTSISRPEICKAFATRTAQEESYPTPQSTKWPQSSSHPPLPKASQRFQLFNASPKHFRLCKQTQHKIPRSLKVIKIPRLNQNIAIAQQSFREIIPVIVSHNRIPPSLHVENPKPLDPRKNSRFSRNRIQNLPLNRPAQRQQ